jgi:hypothetical protein
LALSALDEDHSVAATPNVPTYARGDRNREMKRKQQLVNDANMSSKRNLDKLGGGRRFELLVNAVKDYAIYLLDRDGYIASWNAGAE